MLILKDAFYSFIITCLFFGRHFLITGPAANAFGYSQTFEDFLFISLLVACFFLAILFSLSIVRKYLKDYFDKIFTAILLVSLLPVIDVVFLSILRASSKYSILDSGVLGLGYLLATYLYVPLVIIIVIKTKIERAAIKIMPMFFFVSLVIISYAVPKYFGIMSIQKQIVNSNGNPVHIIIFDGMSYDVLNSPELKSKYPNFNKLAKSSFVFENAYSPGYSTINSVPSFLTGIKYDSIVEEYSKMYISTKNEKRTIYPAKKSIFNLAKKHRYNTVLIGDALPYCNIFGDDLTYGLSFSSYNRLSQILPLPFDSILNLNISHRANKTTRLISEYLSKIAEMPKNSLFYVHILLPHEPYIFDANGFSYNRWDYIYRYTFKGVKFNTDYEKYINQLMYVDKKVGEIIKTLKQNKSYDLSLLIIAADHNSKLEHFQKQEMTKIPLFVKLPHQKKGAIISEKAYSINLKSLLDGYFTAGFANIEGLFVKP